MREQNEQIEFFCMLNLARSTRASDSKKYGTPKLAMYGMSGLGWYSITIGSIVTAPMSNLIGATD